jgi:hypothetical protein
VSIILVRWTKVGSISQMSTTQIEFTMICSLNLTLTDYFRTMGSWWLKSGTTLSPPPSTILSQRGFLNRDKSQTSTKYTLGLLRKKRRSETSTKKNTYWSSKTLIWWRSKGTTTGLNAQRSLVIIGKTSCIMMLSNLISWSWKNRRRKKKWRKERGWK